LIYIIGSNNIILVPYLPQFTSKITAVIILVIIIVVGIIGIGWFVVFNQSSTGQPSMDEDLNTEVTILSEGNLVRIDNSHWGTGVVQIVQDDDGNYFVYFIDVEIASGPQLIVYLSDKPTFSGTNDSPGNYIDLGELPAQSGSFSVSIPTGTNIGLYKSVMIWCEPFSVVFTYATLV
jgi:hypothetical protein